MGSRNRFGSGSFAINSGSKLLTLNSKLSTHKIYA